MADELVQVQAGQARLNITWRAQNGDLADPIPQDSSDAAVLQIAEESIRSGSVLGVDMDPACDLRGFVVDRFAPTQDVPFARVFVRPKTAFGF